MTFVLYYTTKIHQKMKVNSKINSLLFTVAVSLFATCKNETPNVIKTYYGNGSVRSLISYTNDSIKNGKAVYYYPSGQIKREVFYRSNALDSTFKEYYENGKLKIQGNYSFGGNIMGSFYYYNEDGNLRAYNAKDYLGKTFYVIKFDQSGTKIKEDGIVVSPSVGSLNYKDTYQRGDTLDLIFSIAEPPGYKVNATIKEGRENEYRDSDVYTLSRSSIIYKNILRQKGDYKVKCIVKLFNEGVPTRIDSTEITVVVK